MQELLKQFSWLKNSNRSKTVIMNFKNIWEKKTHHHHHQKTTSKTKHKPQFLLSELLDSGFGTLFPGQQLIT